MRIWVRCPGCRARQEIGAARVPSETACRRCGRAIPLALTEALREDREVDACPVCEGRELYVRKDLNRSLGLTAVIIVGLVSAGFLWFGQDLAAYGILGAFALVDFLTYQLLKDVTVCYRCQAEFRGSYRRTARPYDLHLAEEMELEYSRRLQAGPGSGAARFPGD